LFAFFDWNKAISERHFQKQTENITVRASFHPPVDLCVGVLCGIKVFRLIRGNNMGLFHLPLETATVMVTLMVLIACDFLRRRNNTNAPDKTQENG